MTESQEEFDRLLRKAAELRGHLCAGLSLGLKMAQLGLKLLNMTDAEKRNLVVFMENDKCPADAIQIATGCSAGSRRLKMMYYGKSAATFINGTTGKGYRVVEKKDIRARALDLAVKGNIMKAGEKVEENSKLERKILMNAFMKLAPEELFDFYAVKVNWETPLLPSRLEPHRCCSKCGEEIMGGLGVMQNNKILCRSCFTGPYYQRLK